MIRRAKCETVTMQRRPSFVFTATTKQSAHTVGDEYRTTHLLSEGRAD